jgi:hypothetical protein
MAAEPALELGALRDRTVGVSPPTLFPAWGTIQRDTLEAAGIDPPTLELRDADISASDWIGQEEIDWILLTPSLARKHAFTTFRPLSPARTVPYWMQWRTTTGTEPLARRFLDAVGELGVPDGWIAP